jgi:CRISPR-associated endoribonuclease Cas6
MIFEFTFSAKIGDLLPINYQYELGSWVYRTLNQGDEGYAQFLHADGYGWEGKKYKLFTFGQLKPEKYEIGGDRMKILSPVVKGIFSFYTESGSENMIRGLFEQNRLSLGDRKSQVNWPVRNVEVLPNPIQGSKALFKCLSPLVVSEVRLQNGKKMSQYLSPQDEGYAVRFLDNLAHKYQAARPQTPLPDTKEWSLKVLSQAPKSKLSKLKADTPQETLIRGYLFDFELSAPAEVLRFGQEAGFGEKNSMGFGCCQVLKSGVSE